LVEGGNNTYYDAVSGYANIVRGNTPQNVIYGVYNTISGLGSTGIYGNFNTVSGQYVTVVGRNNTISGNEVFMVGRNNTVTQNNSFVYGSAIGTTNYSLHGFGTVTPRKRMDINGDVIISDTIYNTSPATHSTNDGLAVWKNTSLGNALGKATIGSLLLSEPYNTITSTSSPQTLSSTISDNLINQGSTQFTFTLNLPGSPADGQVCTITYNNAISNLTIGGNGNTILGSPVTTAVIGSQRKFKFYTGVGWMKIY
jgi:hypothetical protein